MSIYKSFILQFNVITCFAASSSKYELPLSNWKVTIVNVQKNNATLFAHCKSKDNDLGTCRVTLGQGACVFS